MTKSNGTPLVFTKGVVEEIISTVGRFPPETGGILGASSNGIISHFYYDRTGKSTASGYTPDVSTVNEILTNSWMPNGIFMVGIVHSHANMNRTPSCGDISYGIRILQALNTVGQFYLPIVTRSEDIFEMCCYVISHDPDRQFICRKVDYTVIDE